jgi:hypothetical protein
LVAGSSATMLHRAPPGPFVEALPVGTVSKGAGRHALHLMCFAHRVGFF